MTMTASKVLPEPSLAPGSQFFSSNINANKLHSASRVLSAALSDSPPRMSDKIAIKLSMFKSKLAELDRLDEIRSPENMKEAISKVFSAMDIAGADKEPILFPASEGKIAFQWNLGEGRYCYLYVKLESMEARWVEDLHGEATFESVFNLRYLFGYCVLVEKLTESLRHVYIS